MRTHVRQSGADTRLKMVAKGEEMSEKQAVNGRDPDQGGSSLLSFSLF